MVALHAGKRPALIGEDLLHCSPLIFISLSSSGIPYLELGGSSHPRSPGLEFHLLFLDCRSDFVGLPLYNA